MSFTQNRFSNAMIQCFQVFKNNKLIIDDYRVSRSVTMRAKCLRIIPHLLLVVLFFLDFILLTFSMNLIFVRSLRR